MGTQSEKGSKAVAMMILSKFAEGRMILIRETGLWIQRGNKQYEARHTTWESRKRNSQLNLVK
jgi:hypothetical protein